MPWKESSVVNTRTEFALQALSGTVPFLELCKQYGISRKTGYKWKERFIKDGHHGMSDQSRRPTSSPAQASEEAVCQIVKLKLAHRSWGPRKIRTLFARSFPALELPSESTFKRVLDKAGLVIHRRHRSPNEAGRISNRIVPERPNQVWTVDFKGWWRTKDRERFEPLTIRDLYSRYLLCAQALSNSRTESVRQTFEEVFSRYGLPEVIRSDNGSPFAASNSPLGLSRLSAWWLALGIDLDRIPPARPDQNGSHERMHRDMALEVETRSEKSMSEQQGVLDTWRNTYNYERPHEALGMKVPSELYVPSTKAFDPTPIELDYPVDYLKRQVMKGGAIKFQNLQIGVSVALSGWHVGLKPEAANRYGLWFSRLRLGEIDVKTQRFTAVTDLNERAED